MKVDGMPDNVGESHHLYNHMNSNLPPQAALIGAGGWGKNHLVKLKELSAINELNLVAVADPFLRKDPETLADLKKLNVRCYDNYQQLIAEEIGLKFVVIAAPIHLHEQMVKCALKRDLYVYLEKPPVATIQQLRRLIEMDVKNRVTIGFQLVQFPQMQQLKQWITSGALGTIRNITVTAGWPRADDYYSRANWAGKLIHNGLPVFDGPSTNALSHLIQVVMFLCGETGDRHAIPDWIEGEFYRARPIETYDLAGIRGGFSNGTEFTTLFGHCCAKANPYQLTVKGTKGSVRLDQSGDRLVSDCGLDAGVQLHNYEQAAHKVYHEILSGIKGERDYPLLSLRDCVGYLTSVCGGLISSDGIHTIHHDYVASRKIEGGTVYDLIGLNEILEKTKNGAGLPSAQQAPWAIKGKRLLRSQITNIKLASYMKKDITVDASMV